MGDHDVEGSFKGLGRPIDKPHVKKFRIGGGLGRQRNIEFRKDLAKLLKKYNLDVEPTAPPLDNKAKSQKAKKGPKKNPRKK